MNHKDSSIRVFAQVRQHSFLRMLLTGMSLLLMGFSLQTLAAPVPHNPGGYTYNISPTKDNSVANSGNPDIITVTLNPAPPITAPELITFVISGFGYNPQIPTNSVGQAVLSFTGLVAGPVTVNIYDQGVLIGTQIMNFIAAPFPPDPANSFTTIVQNPAVADGSSQDIVQAFVFDQFGNRVPDGTPVTFTVFTGTATITTTGTTVNGVATADFTSTVVGPVVVNTAVGGVLIADETSGNDFEPIQFIAGPVDVAASYISVTQNPAAADGASQDIVTAYLFDAFGHPITDGTQVTFAISPSTATIVNSAMQPVTAGSVAADYISLTVGTYQVTATVGGVPLHDQANPGNTFVSILFTSGPIDPSKSYIVVTQNPAAADNVAQDIVTAYLFDAQGRPVNDGQQVTFSISPNTPTIVNSAMQSVTTGSVAAEYVSTVTGTFQVQCMINSSGIFLPDQANPTNSFVSIQFIAGPIDPAKSYIVVTQNPAAADDVTQDIVTAYLFDAQGRPVTDGQQVTFSISPNTPTIVNGATQSVTAGSVAAEYVSTATGTFQVQCLVGGVPLPDQANPGNTFVSIQFVAGPVDPAKSYITVIQNPATADNVSQDIVEAFFFDANGNAVTNSNVSVTFSIQPTTAATIVNAASQTTMAGNASAEYVSTLAGNVQVVATVNGVPLHDQNNVGNNYVSIQFVAGTPVNSNPSNPEPPGGGGGTGGSGTGPSSPSDPSGPGGGFTYLTMTFNNVPADGVTADTATAYITDAFKNPVAGVMVIFTLHTGGPANSGALFQPQAEVQDTVYTNANGYAAIPITDTVPGDAWIDASIVVGGVVEVIAGSSAIAHFDEAPDVNNPATQLITVVYEALADGTSTTVVKAHIVDASGNPITDQAVVFSIDSGSAQIITPGPWVTDANGDVFISLTSTTVGKVLITATVDGKSIIFGSPAPVYFAAINIYVPKVFTPNADGTNDVLRPILVGIATFHYFTVYNRWGNIIFTTQDPNQGWDGTFKGVSQPVETYLWIAEGINTEGKKIVQKGMTSLVR